MAFRVGMKVECVDAVPSLDGWQPPLELKAIYTITSIYHIGSRVGLSLVEVPDGPRRGALLPPYRADRFRPVVERKTDISIFTAMLSPNGRVLTTDDALHASHDMGR